MAANFYGCTIPDQRKSEIHIRPMEQMLDHLLGSTTNRSRSLDRQTNVWLSRCHHFTRFLVAMLRAKGVPAGRGVDSAPISIPGSFEDHWVCEYWNAAEARWVLVDPQFDDVWRTKLKIAHDILDVPRDRFLVAGDAWAQCRTGEADPAKFGIIFANLRGLWYVAGNLVRDVAALNKMEMLPWDVWGAQPSPNEPLNDDQLTFFDNLVALAAPDASFAELRQLYEEDNRLHVRRPSLMRC